MNTKNKIALVTDSQLLPITIKQGHFKIVIFTGQYFGEGIGISNLERLFIVYPFEGNLVQYIGRIQRSKKPPVIFDYRDS